MTDIIFMRGLPGSGKSTLARQIAGGDGHVVSADDFFTGADGVYRYNPSMIRVAHNDAMVRMADIVRLGARLVIIDNTSLRLIDMDGYLRIAAQFGARVSTRVPETPWAWDPIECARHTIHGVPAKTIAMLATRWEDLGDDYLADIVAGKMAVPAVR